MSLRKRRILYVQAPSGGGSIISLYELVRGLDTHLYAPITLFYRKNSYCEQFEALGAKVIILQERPSRPATAQSHLATRARRYGAWRRHIVRPIYQIVCQDWPLVRRIARVIRARAIDLVHHNNNLPVNRAAVIAARFTTTPQICHVRWFNNLSFVDKWLARSVKAFVYNSRAVEACYHYQGIAPHKGQVVYNPINLEAFTQPIDISTIRAEFGLTIHDVVISNVGRLDWWKGQDYFLEALAETVHSVPQIKALIVGEVEPGLQQQKYYKRLQHLVTTLRLSNNVIFTGFQTNIPQLMAASDIIVHSASAPEPFGRVVVEAMAACRPVIATAAGGVLEIIEDQVNGFLVPPQNSLAMAKAILHLLNNPEQARTVALRAQQHVRKRFSIQQHIMAVQRMYQHILALEK
jgi:glycosyltransferase involved in cell wall biosynthesis